jgi:signal transduction histidine kinase
MPKPQDQNRNAHLEMMARMVSHNLRSPMAGVKMLFSLHELAKNQAEKDDIFENLKEGAEELFAMVEELSKVLLDYKHLIVEKEEVIFDEVLSDVKEELHDLIQVKEASISADFENGLSFIYVPGFMHFILYEMLSNALRYASSERKLHLRISTYLQDGFMVLEIEDNGIGIDLEKHKDQVFRMYKTFHNNPKIKNRGIGLFTIKNQVEILGGKVSVESKPNQGTLFRLLLSH